VAKKINDLIREYSRLSGDINEENEYVAVQGIMPGLKDAMAGCEDSHEAFKKVVGRLEEISDHLIVESNAIYLPAEVSYLHSQLRAILSNILASEKPVRKALAALEQLA